MSTPSLVLKKVSNGQDVPISGLIRVGRSEESNVRLLEDKTSRNHALISTDGAQVFVEDLGSANGTFVNDRRIAAKTKVKLSAGDRLRFDIEEFVLWDAAPAAVAAPSADLDKTQYRAPAACNPEAVNATPPARNEAPAKSGLPDAFEIDGGNKTVFVPKKAKAKAAVVHADGLQPASGDQPYLLVTSGAQTGGKIELSIEAGAKKKWTIGSGPDRTICFAETGVSAKHASLTHDKTRWQLEDDLSLSGTYLNDTKIFRDHLSDGDRLMFGPVECVFRIPPPTPTQDVGGARLKKIGIILAIACAVTLALIFIVSKLPK
jgi:pSer/pThr/pTyr-binding forkhead associated (FHA) protein